MPGTLDVSDDFEIFDNTEDVTVRSRGAGDTYTNHTGVLALRRVRSISDMDGQANREVVWNLKEKDLAGQPVRVHDRIRDVNGVEWLVLSAELATWRTRWRCRCVETVATTIPPLTAGVIFSNGAPGQTTVPLIATDATGGILPYTYQWYRSTSPGFTPSGANIIPGATSLTLNDTGLDPNTDYYYKIVYTDSAP